MPHQHKLGDKGDSASFTLVIETFFFFLQYDTMPCNLAMNIKTHDVKNSHFFHVLLRFKLHEQYQRSGCISNVYENSCNPCITFV